MKNLGNMKFPPTEDSAIQYIKQANFQCVVWNYARNPLLKLSSPVGNGWKLDDMGNLMPYLMRKQRTDAKITRHENARQKNAARYCNKCNFD